MTNAIKALLGCLAAASTVNCMANSGAFTLYRNSTIDPTMRIHVATFDTTDGERYNSENCNLAATLFISQPGVETRYWCERGTYKK